MPSSSCRLASHRRSLCSREIQTKSKLERITRAFAIFRQRVGHYPPESRDVVALVEKPTIAP
ncbi:MAG: hypothetical protein QF405_16005 [Roseibacillus sp.]|nr:hypothetical protein [Roseibacillus sp.]MDP7309147.1 hypothetical protein [Roseibacillus sp.]HJM64706.1 hypothetical protein [Roseibacillus sp.]